VITLPEVAAAPVVVEPARADDDRHIHALFAALHAFNGAIEPRFALAPKWPRVLDGHLTHERAAGHSATFLAWRGNQPLGLLMMGGHADSPLFRDRHWAEVLALYVVPEARGRGVAEALLQAGLAWALAHGYDHARLYVTVANERARRFYARAGFRPMQEVWALDLIGAQGVPDDDLECEAHYALGHHLLTPNPHLGGDEACPSRPAVPPDRTEGVW
jgi:ribosomal protein S18 acetylase RimI-like enzyme